MTDRQHNSKNKAENPPYQQKKQDNSAENRNRNTNSTSTAKNQK